MPFSFWRMILLFAKWFWTNRWKSFTKIDRHKEIKKHTFLDSVFLCVNLNLKRMTLSSHQVYHVYYAQHVHESQHVRTVHHVPHAFHIFNVQLVQYVCQLHHNFHSSFLPGQEVLDCIFRFRTSTLMMVPIKFWWNSDLFKKSTSFYLKNWRS